MASLEQSRRRSFWLKQLHQWHWISSALCLIGMLLFAATGFTLNHATQIESKPRVTTVEAQLPDTLLATMQQSNPAAGKAPLPPELAEWVHEALSVRSGARAAEWSEDEVYLALPRPGGDAWLSIDLQSGAATYEATDRGWISYFNDLHKGRNTGPAWSWFIDVFAGACLVFCLTGLFLLQMHAGQRPATWPAVGAGLVIPLLLAVLLIH